MTLDDLIETRVYQTKQSMRFPVDEDTTKKLRAVILNKPEPLPLWRRVLKKLRGAG